jgi:hypothetical protein
MTRGLKGAKGMFGKGYTMTLNRVHDKINLREGDEVLPLIVDGDSMRMVAGLGKAQAKLLELKDDSTDDEVKDAAEYFAAVIFGKEQAKKIMEFYADDPGCVISVCGQYFKDRLAGKISKIQKKIKV